MDRWTDIQTYKELYCKELIYIIREDCKNLKIQPVLNLHLGISCPPLRLPDRKALQSEEAIFSSFRRIDKCCPQHEGIPYLNVNPCQNHQHRNIQSNIGTTTWPPSDPAEMRYKISHLGFSLMNFLRKKRLRRKFRMTTRTHTHAHTHTIVGIQKNKIWT